ncbi:MAG: methyltransferase [Pirellulales bacterium]
MKIPSTWTFKNEKVAKGFDSHVREQLPWYELATQSVAHIVRHYLPPHGLMYDIGASTGNIGRAVSDVLEERQAKLVAIEESKEMCDLYDAPGDIECISAYQKSFQPYDVAVCFLVLMFIPVSQRKVVIENLRRSLNRGGVIIVFDKVSPDCGYFGTVTRRLTMSWKLTNGASPSDIVAKELSLSGIQRPINPEILGPDAVPFFNFGEFAGFVIERKE